MRQLLISTILSLIFMNALAYREQSIPVINKTESDIKITYKQCSSFNDICSDTMSAIIKKGVDRNNIFEFNQTYMYVTSITKGSDIVYFADRSNYAALSKMAGGDENVRFCTATYGTALEIMTVGRDIIKCVQRTS